jgi:hypothetical protein
MAIEVQDGHQGKQQGHPQQAEDLEIDPHLLGQVEGDIGIGDGAEREKASPRQIDAIPDRIRQLHLLAQHPLDQRLLEDELTDQQGAGEQQVNHCDLPFDESIIVEEQGETTKHQHHSQSDEMHLLQLAQGEPGDGDLQHGHHHQGAGSSIDVIELVDGEKHQQGDQIEKLFHACTSSERGPSLAILGGEKKQVIKRVAIVEAIDTFG